MPQVRPLETLASYIRRPVQYPSAPLPTQLPANASWRPAEEVQGLGSLSSM